MRLRALRGADNGRVRGGRRILHCPPCLKAPFCGTICNSGCRCGRRAPDLIRSHQDSRPRRSPIGEWRVKTAHDSTKRTLDLRIRRVDPATIACMHLRELIRIIAQSDPSEWHHIACWGAHAGPSYRDRFLFREVHNESPGFLLHEAHSSAAVYIPDISITMAFGLGANEDFKEEWANQFPDEKASSSFVDVFYNAALVYRAVYVTVDGAVVSSQFRGQAPERFLGQRGTSSGCSTHSKQSRNLTATLIERNLLLSMSLGLN